MSNKTIKSKQGFGKQFFGSLWFRVLVFLIFLVSVNLLSGYLAVKLNYASLWNVHVKFGEYAIPLPFNWGLAHIPSMLVYGLPLIFLLKWPVHYVKYYRLFCICSFLLLSLELDKKIPFLLFPKVDAIVALFFSFVLKPPNHNDNPVQVTVLKILASLGFLLLGYYLYGTWKHQSPKIENTQYLDGVFELKSITVNNDYRKSMEFDVDLKMMIPEERACQLGQTLAQEFLHDYPFDKNYNQLITVTFNPSSGKYKTYPLGEISLNEGDKDKDGRFACYLRYKKKTK